MFTRTNASVRTVCTRTTALVRTTFFFQNKQPTQTSIIHMVFVRLVSRRACGEFTVQ